MVGGVATTSAKFPLDSVPLLGSGGCVDCLSLNGVTPSDLKDLLKGRLPQHHCCDAQLKPYWCLLRSCIL